jgi:hypothetical protein
MAFNSKEGDRPLGTPKEREPLAEPRRPLTAPQQPLGTPKEREPLGETKEGGKSE